MTALANPSKDTKKATRFPWVASDWWVCPGTSSSVESPLEAGTSREIAGNRDTGQAIRGIRGFHSPGGPRARQLPDGAMVLQGFGLAGHVSWVVFACTQV